MLEIGTSGLTSGGEKTWLRMRLRHRHRAKAAGQPPLPQPKAGRVSPRLYRRISSEVANISLYCLSNLSVFISVTITNTPSDTRKVVELLIIVSSEFFSHLNTARCPERRHP